MFRKVDYVMLMVSNMKRSVKFYRDTLGLPLKFESPEWTEFKTGATTFALHGGARRAKKAKKSEALAGSCFIGFSVGNVDKTYKDLRARGVRFTMKPEAREGEPIKLAVGLDPDGHPISFAQHIG
jgi:catechol 2,3-dioxygenase-like lactoylglutathione lyase family enzyme